MTPERRYRKPYQQPQSRRWWLHNRFFVWYMVREATSIFTLGYALLLLVGLLRLNQGEVAWEGWLVALSSPLAIGFHMAALVALLYHAHTFFALFPKVLVLRFRGWTVPGSILVMSQWLALLAVTVVIVAVAWFEQRGAL